MGKRCGQSGFTLTMTPLIDIVFQLIAFFIFALNYSPHPVSSSIRPPRGTDALDAASAAALLIEIDRDGQLIRPEALAVSAVGDRPAQLQRLIETLRPGQAVVVRADEHTRYEAVDRVLASLRGRPNLIVALRLRTEERP